MGRKCEEESGGRSQGTGAGLAGQLPGQPRRGRAAFTPSKEKMGVKKKVFQSKTPTFFFYLKENNTSL